MLSCTRADNRRAWLGENPYDIKDAFADRRHDDRSRRLDGSPEQLGVLRTGSRRLELLDALADQHRQRQEPETCVDVQHRRQIRLLREHAARYRRRHVLLRAERLLRHRRGDGEADLEVSRPSDDAARCLVLAGRCAVARQDRRIDSKPSRGAGRETGLPVADFGEGGFVDMGCTDGVTTRDLQGPAHHAEHETSRSRVECENWRAGLDVQPGGAARRSGHKTWENDAWKTIGGTNVWGYLTVDTERGIAYAPVSIAGSDYVGVHGQATICTGHRSSRSISPRAS